MAQLKISEYPAKTVFNNGDLYDVSTFDGVNYTSEKMTFTQLKTQLNADLSFASASLYTGSGTVPSATTATITDTINFDGGSVGIGVTPTETFHVDGNGRVDGTLDVNRSTAGEVANFSTENCSFSFNSSSSSGFDATFDMTDTALEISHNAGIRGVQIKGGTGIGLFVRGNTGKTGINTITPTGWLSVVGDAFEPTIKFSSSGTANDYFMDSSGNSGFGTASPSEKLHVNGKIRCDSVFNVSGTDGFTGTGSYTNFTIVGGIITSAS